MLPRQRRRGLLPLRDSFQSQFKSSRALLPLSASYDEVTGQVYTETTSRILSSRDQAWSRSTVVMRENKTRECNSESKGVRSLQEIALDQALHSINDFTEELIETIPTILVKRLWSLVKERYEFIIARHLRKP